MAGFKCPFCDEIMSVHAKTMSIHRFNFDTYGFASGATIPHMQIIMYQCPNEECQETTVIARGIRGFMDNIEVPIYPQATFERYPEYVPLAIRSDYEEACKILQLSPKASATLARRCLQGMIRDFWKILDKTLNKEIAQLQGNVPATQWRAIDAVRKIGNIGAHMEKDVNLIVDIDPEEAEKLIMLVEHLIESWYISRHESEKLYADLVAISDEKADARKV